MKKLLISTLLFGAMLANAAELANMPPAGIIAISSDNRVLEYDSAKAVFSVSCKPSGKVFIKNGRLDSSGGPAKLIPVQDKTFGPGQGIEISHANGDRSVLALHPGLPFVVVRSTRHNGDAAPKVLKKAPVFTADVDTGAALPNVKTLGTGGLLAPDGNTGSYAFLAIVDPASRGGVVGGWLTHDRGSGVVFSPVTSGILRMQARIDYGRLRINPGADAELETFLLGWFDDARDGLEAYADAIAARYAIKLPPKQAGLCTWYMDKYAGACDEKHLPSLADVAARELKPFGFDFVQIDDRWQEGGTSNGPKKNFSTHAAKGPYPGGMKAAADNIAKSGLVPGIWLIPFAGDNLDPFFADKQNYFVKTPDGKPFNARWGGTCLDMTNPQAKDYVQGLIRRIVRDWGYKFLKLDGFWTGSGTRLMYVNDGYKEDEMGEAVFANPDKTNIEALRDGTKAVREAAGPGVFLLGCCAPQNMRSFGGTFGLLDAMRVGPDTGGNIGSLHGSRLWFLNGRVWWNDPDCVFVRSSQALDRARLNASWTAIADQLFYISDWLPEMPRERMDIIKRCLPAHGLRPRPVDVFEQGVARIWLLSDTRRETRRDVVALYNWSKDSESISEKAGRIGLPPAKEYVGFDFWENKFLPPFQDKISSVLPPESCRVLAIRPVSDHPQLISSSRHLTQGMVDVEKEVWLANESILSGASKVEGNDPYELRIVTPVGNSSWRAAAVSVSKDDEAAGVKASFTQDGPKIRVQITSGAAREIHWQARFEKAQMQCAAPEKVTELKAVTDRRGVTISWKGNADLYRLEKIGGPTYELPASSFTDPNVAMGKTFQYRVTALGWNGTVSDSAAVEGRMTVLECPPVPPTPAVYLDTLKAVESKSGSGKSTPGKSISGGPLQVNGKTYAHGIGTHSPGLAVYNVPGGATRFVSMVGLDEKVKSNNLASVVFQVFGDVLEMGEKPVLLAESPVLRNRTIRYWALDAPLDPRYKRIRLVVTDAGDGSNSDHADWVDAGFLMSGK